MGFDPSAWPIVQQLADASGLSAPFELACSGGLDSMALLHALLDVGRPPSRVLTVDHGLRAGSGVDAKFVVQVAAELGLPSKILTVEVESGAGPEDAARRARYAALEGATDATIALAHTADDQVETVLMRLADGAGVRGLAGIPATRDQFVRPWLNVTRAEIAEYAQARRVQWREDSTNASAAFRRNRVRAAMPALDEALGAEWRAGALRSAAHLRRADALSTFFLGEWLSDGLRADAEAVWIERSRISDAPAEARKTLLWHVLARTEVVLGSLDRRYGSTIEALLPLFLGQGGGVDLPGGLRAERDPVAVTIWRPIGQPERRSVTATLGLMDWSPWTVEVQGDVTGLSLRSWSVGDGYVSGSGTQRSVARAWSAAGVPRRLRATLPVLASSNAVVWAPGLPENDAQVRARLGVTDKVDVAARAWWSNL